MACSCICTFEHTVSEFLEDHIVFLGKPIQSVLTSENLVTTDVEVLEGFGKYDSTKTVQIKSRPENGGNCGVQLNIGVEQIIVARVFENNNYVSSCKCAPPYAYLLRFLKTNEDTFLPNLNDCWKEDRDDIKSTNKCKVWRDAPDDWIEEWNEIERYWETTKTD